MHPSALLCPLVLLGLAACAAQEAPAPQRAAVVTAPRGLERLDHRVRARIDTGAAQACAVVSAGGFVWVSSLVGPGLTKVDPAENRVVARVALPGRPCHMAAALGLLWIKVESAGLIVGLDPRTDRIVRRIRTEPTNQCAHGFAFGEGVLWVAEPIEGIGSATRRDPRTGATVAGFDRRRIPNSAGPCAVAVAGGSAWLGSMPRVIRVDARSGRVLGLIDAGFNAESSMLATGDDVWVGNDTYGEMRRLDARTGQVAAVYRAGGGDMAAGPDELWATSSRHTSDAGGRRPVLVRVDRRRDRVLGRYRVGPTAPPVNPTKEGVTTLGGLALAHGSLWVAHNAERRLYRIGLPVPSAASGR